MIRELMKNEHKAFKDLDAISVNEGPGSFTSLRIGLVMAKGLSYALNLPLILIPGLKALASNGINSFPEKKYFLSVIDARRDEVYYALYDNKLSAIKPAQAALLSNEWYNSLNVSDNQCVVIGSGLKKWSEFIETSNVVFGNKESSAVDLIPLAYQDYGLKNFVPVADARPFYLKEPNITIPKEKL